MGELPEEIGDDGGDGGVVLSGELPGLAIELGADANGDVANGSHRCTPAVVVGFQGSGFRGQGSGVSGQFSVLSSQLSVESSQFSVLSVKGQGFRAVWHAWGDCAPGGLNYVQIQMTDDR